MRRPPQVISVSSRWAANARMSRGMTGGLLLLGLRRLDFGGLRGIRGLGRLARLRRLVAFLEPLLELVDARADAAHQLRDLRGAEEEHDHAHDDNELHRGETAQGKQVHHVIWPSSKPSPRSRPSDGAG